MFCGRVFLKWLTPCKCCVELRRVPYLIKLANISLLCKKGVESVMFFWGGLLNDFKTKRDKINVSKITHA